MKRTVRRLFNFTAAVSLVLSVATAILWIRSYWTSDELSYIAERLSVTGFGDPPQGTVYRRNWAIYHLDGTIRVYVNRDEPLTASVPASSPSDQTLYAEWKFQRYKRDRGYPMLVRRDDTFIHRIGFEFITSTTRFRPDGRLDVAFPYWALEMGCVVVLATWTIRTMRTSDRRKPGHCEQCGYDLRATPDRCPECGAVLSAAKKSAG